MTPKFTVMKRAKVPLIDFHDPIGLDGKVRLFIASDVHFDNPKTQQDTLHRHLTECVDGGWPWISAGDWFCAMQGAWDPRKSKSDIRPENMVPDYLDSLVTTSADFLEFAAPNAAVFYEGNHEGSIMRRHETCLNTRLTERMRAGKKGSPVITAGIGGWLLVRVRLTKTTGLVYKIWVHHGTGSSGGPVTKGTIATARRAAAYDADCFITGHIHERWVMTTMRARCDERTGRTWTAPVLHVQCPSYKEEFSVHKTTWHTSQERPPKPVGGTFLELAIGKDFDGLLKGGKDTRKRRLPMYKFVPNVVWPK